jgi:hypothetical protein
VRPLVAAAAASLLLAAPELAYAGTVTPIQYAYGGGSNAAAVIASQPPATAQQGTQQGSGGGPVSSSGSGAASATSGSPAKTRPQPLVGIAASPAGPVGSFDALHRAIPTDALWAIAFAAACALGAWLVRRGRGAG